MFSLKKRILIPAKAGTQSSKNSLFSGSPSQAGGLGGAFTIDNSLFIHTITVMTHTFWSRDFGAFVFGRAILKKNPKAQLELHVAQTGEKKGISENDLWEKGVQEILKSQTRFGRVGLFFDRGNSEASPFCNNVVKTKADYTPQEPRRAEKKAKFTPFQMQTLCSFANEGLSDSVEFRRLARKFIRPAKHAHCDTIFFLDVILGEEKTRKILQHIAGTQIKLFFPDDFLGETKASTAKERVIKIESGEENVFTRKMAEKILRTKLKK